MHLTNPIYQADSAPQHEHEEVREAQRRIRSTRIAVFLLLVLVAGLGYYGYSLYRGHELQLGHLPNVQATLASLGGELNQYRESLAAWAQEQKGLSERLAKLEKSTRANLQLTRKFAHDVGKDLEARLFTEMDRRSEVLEARLQQMEAEQKAQQAHLASFEKQFREEMTAVREDAARDLTRVGARIDENARQLHAVEQQQNPQRVEFEAAKDQVQELTPRLHMRITGTNVGLQAYNGWVQLLPEGRTVWVRSQSVNRPVRVYHKEGGQPYEIVITDVGRDFALGYLLLPSSASEVAQAPAGVGGTVTSSRSGSQR